MAYFEDSDLIIGKKYYEVALLKRTKGSVDDFVTEQYDGCGEPYRECAKAAKGMSLDWDACDVVCYTATEWTSCCVIWVERYIKGKKIWRKNINEI